MKQIEPNDPAVVAHPSGFAFEISVNHTVVICSRCMHENQVHDAIYTELLVCAGCGMAIDMQGRVQGAAALRTDSRPTDEDGKVLRAIDCPLSVGASGTLRGEPLLVVGVVTMGSKDPQTGEPWAWKDYLLLNPQGEYRYLTVDDDHFILSRDDAALEREADALTTNLWNKASVRVGDRSYLATSLLTARVLSIEGQLNSWRLPNDQIEYVEGFDPPFVVSVERRKSASDDTSWSCSRGEWLSAEEVITGFPEELGRGGSLRTWFGYSGHDWGHAAQPIWRSATQRLITKSIAALSLLALIAALVLSVLENTQPLFRTSVTVADLSDGVLTKSFTIDKAPVTGKLFLSVPRLSNSWVYVTAQIVDVKSGKALVELSHEVSYYYGVEGGESWSEGSTSESGYFRITRPGTYRLLLSGEFDGYSRDKTLNVEISGGYVLVRWLLLAGLLGLIYPGLVYRRRRRLHKEGWNEVTDDGNEEDDD